jgi:purine-binding chemotaxis protein CheW
MDNALVVTHDLAKAGNEDISNILQLVTFKLGDEEYAIDILKVQEINRMKEITKMPNSPPDVEGVVNLRGRVIPVVNLRKKFGMEQKDDDSHARIMIIDIDGMTFGVIVDCVEEVLRIPSNIVEPVPPMTTAVSSQFIMGIAKMDDRLIILIDLQKVFGIGESALIDNR